MTRQNSSIKPTSPSAFKEDKKPVEYQNSLLESFYSEGFDGPANRIEEALSHAQSKLPKMETSEIESPPLNSNNNKKFKQPTEEWSSESDSVLMDLRPPQIRNSSGVLISDRIKSIFDSVFQKTFKGYKQQLELKY